MSSLSTGKQCPKKLCQKLFYVPCTNVRITQFYSIILCIYTCGFIHLDCIQMLETQIISGFRINNFKRFPTDPICTVSTVWPAYIFDKQDCGCMTS